MSGSGTLFPMWKVEASLPGRAPVVREIRAINGVCAERDVCQDELGGLSPEQVRAEGGTVKSILVSEEELQARLSARGQMVFSFAARVQSSSVAAS